MTNLDIIKYLAANNPTRLAEFLDDIYCVAWNNGAYAQFHIDDVDVLSDELEFTESNWLNQVASANGFFLEAELEEWRKHI
jgi:hypothetical protein